MRRQGLDYFQLRKLLTICGMVIVSLFLPLFGYLLSTCKSAVNPSDLDVSDTPARRKISKISKKGVNLSSLREGPLALLDQTLYIPFPNLSDEIVLIGRNDRPDADKKSLKFKLGLRGSEHNLEVSHGERIFLNFNQQGMKFDRNKTPLWIRPVLEKNQVVLESGLELSRSMNGRLVDESKRFVLHQTGRSRTFLGLDTALSALTKVRVYHPDQLLMIYGGDQYRPVKMRPRFEFMRKDGPEMLFLSVGDILIWKNCRWQLANCGAKTRDYPMAQLTALDQSSAVLRVWDRTGFHSEEIGTKIAAPTPLSFRIEDVFARIRQRTLTSVSCKLSGKSAILRKGDWIMRTGSGWKVLKSAGELSQYLDYKNLGELFVFDGIAKESSGAYFTGHLFDITRSISQNVRLPLMDKKRSSKVEVKKSEADEFPPLFEDDFDDEFDLDEIY